MAKFCAKCGSSLEENVKFCPSCGAAISVEEVSNNTQSFNNDNSFTKGNAKSKMAAGILGLFLGAWGIHNFYLGYTGRAILQIVLTIVTCGVAGIWGFIEGILILTGSIDTDANGVKLVD